MGNYVVRCKDCIHAETDAKQYPCVKCSEIQFKNRKDTMDYYSKSKEDTDRADN